MQRLICGRKVDVHALTRHLADAPNIILNTTYYRESFLVTHAVAVKVVEVEPSGRGVFSHTPMDLVIHDTVESINRV